MWGMRKQTRTAQPLHFLLACCTLVALLLCITHQLHRAEPLALHDLRYLVIGPFPTVETAKPCGGCTALFVLYEEFQKLENHVQYLYIPPWLPETHVLNGEANCGSAEEMAKTIVVHAESSPYRCKHKALKAIRWIMQPLGHEVPLDIVKHYAADDWVLHYGPTGSPSNMLRLIPWSNLLVAQRNPYPGDEFDPARYPAVKQRKGTVFAYRKGPLFLKDKLKVMHQPNDTQLLGGESHAVVVEHFLTHEYFVCYDPYSWLVNMAAQLGCIPVQHPLPGMTKYEWIMGSYYGGFMMDRGLNNLQGIAYGWDDVPYARSTLHNNRKEMFEVKAWGAETIHKLVQDVNNYAIGNFSGIRRAGRVRDYYVDPAGKNWE